MVRGVKHADMNVSNYFADNSGRESPGRVAALFVKIWKSSGPFSLLLVRFNTSSSASSSPIFRGLVLFHIFLKFFGARLFLWKIIDGNLHSFSHGFYRDTHSNPLIKSPFPTNFYNPLYFSTLRISFPF